MEIEETTRKLASVQRVLDLSPIENADKIEVAHILGWKVVVKKGEFKVGDLAVYFEVDSLIPEEILKKFNLWDNERDKGKLAGSKGNRLKTVRLRGQISQGLLIPLSIVNDFTQITEGIDVTEKLGVKKYNPPIPVQLQGIMEGQFPSFLKRTDSKRVQSNPGLIEEMRDRDCYITIKIEGTSGTFYNRIVDVNNEFGVCSRNIDLKETDTNTYWKIARQYELKDLLKDQELCIQGEIYGNGIEGNVLGESDHKLAVFDIFDIKDYKYFNYKDLVYFCRSNKLPMVEVIYEGKFIWNSIDELLELADQQKYPNGEFAEGIVIRPQIESYSNVLGGRLAFKVISPSYLLKHGR